MEEGWFMAPFTMLGEPASDAGVDEGCGISGEVFEAVSVTSAFALGLGFTRLGFVIGIEDLTTVREANALARAR